jgi:L-ascorbate metabolism protein UlaG (beta-lactamase superfamily)
MPAYRKPLVTSLIVLALVVSCERGEATPTPRSLASQASTVIMLPTPTRTPLPTAISSGVSVTATPEAPAQASPSSLQITYVGVTSFLVAAGGKKVLVDAHVTTVPAEVQTAIKAAQPPFDDLDLILVTHQHSDHFDPSLVKAHLEENPKALFASTAQTTKELLAISPNLARDRVRAFEPGEGERIPVTLNGIEVEVLNLPHGVPVTNLGFVVHLGDWKLLHTGDMAGDVALRAYGLADEGLDVAFVPYFSLLDEELLTETGQSKVLQAIQARQIVPMHLPWAPSERGNVFRALATRYPASIRFRQAMETRVIPGE